MQTSVRAGELASVIAARLGAGGDLSSSGAGGVGSWVLAVSSLLALIAVGGAAARVARRLARRSMPEMLVLLNESASFYARWPEDRLATAPRDELKNEAARCRRIIELLEPPIAAAIDDGPAACGAVDGLRAWTTLLYKRIDGHLEMPSGPAYA